MTPDRLTMIINNILGPVWHITTKKPRLSKTWRKLRPGDQLTNNQVMTLDGRTIPITSLWQVVSVDSTGAVLDLLAVEPQVGYKLRQAEWAALFTKQRKASRPTRKDP